MNSIDSFLSQLMGQGPVGTISVPLESLLSGVSGGNQRSRSAPPSSAGSGAVGSVFRGELPPALWVQREQQRSAPQGGSSASATSVARPREVTFEEQEAERLRVQGNHAFQSGSYKEAIELYTHAINLYPSSYSYCNRSLTHLKLGNIVEAVADAEEAVNLNPNSYKAYYRLGTALTARGDYRRALDSLRRASALASEESEKEAIKVALAKCESKQVRIPATRLLSESSSTSGIPPESVNETPLDFKDLLNLAKKALETRSQVGEYRSHFDEQQEVVECRLRFRRVQELLRVASSTPLEDLVAQAKSKQDALRRMLKSGERQTYIVAKKDRDECYQQMWEAAEELERAVKELQLIAKEEKAFFEHFGSDRERNRVEEVEGGCGAREPSVEERASPEDLNDSEHFEQILERRLEIEEEVRKVQQRLAVTEEAGREFFCALLNEERSMEKLQPLLKEAASLHLEMERRARHIARTTTTELSEKRLDELCALYSTVDTVKKERETFKASLDAGNMLLEKEAKVEQERLLLEKQRIQTQGEIEWLKVCDESQNKINYLENGLQQIKRKLEALQAEQQNIQSQLVCLIEGDHPELAWSSMLSGSRIQRLVKGSGLWLNISLSDVEVTGQVAPSGGGNLLKAVYRGETVGLKEIAIEDEKAGKRFRTEVSVVARCRHPNVIAIKGVFFDGGKAYVMTPYFHRGSLQDFIERKEMIPSSEVQDIFRQLVSGVAYLHEQGIIHTNIRPSNIFLGDHNRPIIADFGFANRSSTDFEEGSPILSISEDGNGGEQQYYFAPELLEGSQKPSCASDVWSLGRTLYDVASYNAYFTDSSLGVPSTPTLFPSQMRVEVAAKRVGDEQLADLISSMLMHLPQRRPTAYELLAHPYFSVSLNSHQFNKSTALINSDGRLEVVRSYIHAIRKEHSKVLVSVQRSRMVESIAAIFPDLSEKEIIAPIMVVFQGEAGIDEGALTTEMLNLYYEQLVSHHHALVCADGDSSSTSAAPQTEPSGIVTGLTYLPAADDSNIDLNVFELLGKMMLKNVVENRPLPLDLNSSILKFFCNAAVSIVDLEEFDRTLAQHLKQLRLLSEEDLVAAYLDFSQFPQEFLSSRCNGVYSLNTTVRSCNVRDYVSLSVEYFLIYKRHKALEAMKKGFYHFMSLSRHLQLLTPFDLQILLSGMQHIDPQVIISALDFKNFPASSSTPSYLQETLSHMTQNNLRRFLQLCTSTATVPASGAMKKITVVCCADRQRLPVGHGCVYQLDLPDYNDKRELEEKLLVALAHVTDGFHIV